MIKINIMVENYKITEHNYCGNCPECGHSWSKGEVIDVLMGIKTNSFDIVSDNLSQTIGFTANTNSVINRDSYEAIARKQYGWTPENKKHISNLIFIEPSDGDEVNNYVDGYYQCPNCQIAWGSMSGERTDKYRSMLVNDRVMKEFLERLRKS